MLSFYSALLRCSLSIFLAGYLLQTCLASFYPAILNFHEKPFCFVSSDFNLPIPKMTWFWFRLCRATCAPICKGSSYQLAFKQKDNMLLILLPSLGSIN